MFGNDMTQDDLRRLYDANVVDQNGDKVGGVGQIYLDDQTDRPTWATVKTGLFGTKETFVPLAEAQLSADEIRVPYTKDFIKDAPNMDADHHLSEAEEDELYRYYNIGNGVAGTQQTTTTTTGTAAAGRVEGDRAAGDDPMVRREEELKVCTERVATGRVRLRKHVVTENETVNVPVTREEVHIEREPIREGDHAGRIGEGEKDIAVTTHEDRVVVDKDTVAKERIGLGKDVHTENQKVNEQVRKEQVEVVREDGHTDRDGDIRR